MGLTLQLADLIPFALPPLRAGIARDRPLFAGHDHEVKNAGARMPQAAVGGLPPSRSTCRATSRDMPYSRSACRRIKRSLWICVDMLRSGGASQLGVARDAFGGGQRETGARITHQRV
jgi:hypothetical protein